MRAPCGVPALCACLLLACGQTDPGSTPTATVREFVQLMSIGGRNPEALKDVPALLDKRSRRALWQRAKRASTLAGRGFEPWQMLAPGRFRLRFTPAVVGGLRERITGDSAVVVVTGANSGERAEIPLIREDGRWRISLELPDMRRPTAEAADEAAAESARATDR